MKQAILLYNSQAGRGKIGRNLEQVVAIFRDAGYDITPVPLRFDGDPVKGYESVDLIVVAGGDGTLNYVVNALMRHSLSIPIGILPAGTANDFAGALGMSNNLKKAARQIAYGVVE
ncbi:MAG: acylglycerol kinase family protein, partial [Alistipes sp.]|nr:acylglycerol kinase family protein [Alistipes sp.]